jgi:hypothetical protein
MTFETLGSQRCTARSSQHDRACQAWAVRGSNVCVAHGGAAPQVKRKAEERLRSLVNPALAALARLIGDADAGRRGAESEAVQLGAIKDVLDRAGYTATQKLAVSGDLTVRSPVDLELDDLAQALRDNDRPPAETPANPD